MHRYFYAGLLSVIPGALLALHLFCAKESPTQLDTDKYTGTISGRVLSRLDGQPVKGALVSINADSSTPGITNDQGVFMVGRVAAGLHRLHFTHRDYDDDSTYTVNVGSGEQKTMADTVRLSLAYYILKGRIVKDGIMVKGAGVSLARTTLTTLTGDEGEYVLARVPKDALLKLICAKQAIGFNVRMLNETPAADDTTDVGDIPLDKTGADVAGTVFGLTKDPLSGAVVTCAGEGIRAITDEDGRYHISGVPADEPDVCVSVVTGDSTAMGALTGITLAEGAIATGMDIYLHRPADLVNGMYLDAADCMVEDTAQSALLWVMPSTDVNTVIKEYVWSIDGASAVTSAVPSFRLTLTPVQAQALLKTATVSPAASGVRRVAVVAHNAQGSTSAPRAFEVRVRNTRPSVRFLQTSRDAAGPYGDSVTVNTGAQAFFCAGAEDAFGGLDSCIWTYGTSAATVNTAPLFPMTQTWRFDSAGTWRVVMRIVDADGNNAADTVFVVVNRTPVFSEALPVRMSVKVDTTSRVVLPVNDRDGDRVNLSFTRPLANFGITGDTLVCRPAAADTGWHTVSIVADDSRGGRDTLSLEVYVALNMSSNALLDSLVPSAGVMVPPFKPDSLLYRLDLNASDEYVRLRPVSNDHYATALVDNVYVPRGASSQLITTLPGTSDTVEVTSTAQDGSTICLYRVIVSRRALSGVSLSYLAVVPGGVMVPSFDPDTLTYHVGIAADVGTIRIIGVAASAQAAITLNNSVVPSGQISNFISVTDGDTIKVSITAPGNIQHREYNLIISTAASDDAFLAGLLSSSGTLSPSPFKPDIYAYRDSVPGTTVSLTLRPFVYDTNAVIVIAGDTVHSGSPTNALPLAGGENTFALRVYAENRLISKTYTVIIFRDFGSNAGLTNIITPRGSLSPAFSASIALYRDTVEFEQTAYPVRIIPIDPNAKLKIGASPVAADSVYNVMLSNTTTTATVTVTSERGLDSMAWTIAIVRKTDCALSSLGIPPQVISPAFSPESLNYSATVENTVSSVQVVPIARTAGTATIMVNGSAVTSGTASNALSLVVGANAITTVVTSSDGFSTRTYTITVTRKPSNNARLQSLAVSQGVLKPSFADSVYAYTDTVDIQTASLIMTLTTKQANATIRINGTAVTSGSASGAIALNYGANPVAVEVTAEDRSTVQNYTINVIRKPNTDANTCSLFVAGTALTPAFDSLTTAYTAAIPFQQTKIAVRPVLKEPRAQVKVNGTVVPSGSWSDSIGMNVGANTIKLDITALDTINRKTYTVIVNRHAKDSVINGMLVTGTDTLKKSGSPYHLTNSIYVSAGATLVVEPGVELLMDGGISFDIHGTFVARGTATDSITFTAYNLNSRWGYILFADDAKDASYASDMSVDSGCMMQYCGVMYGGNNSKNGTICCVNSSPAFMRCRIAQNSNSGIDCNNSTDGGLMVKKCDFTGNGGNGGVYTESSVKAVLIDSCTFISNTAGGYLTCGTAELRLSDCIFRGNTNSTCLTISANGPAYVRRCVFEENTAGGSVIFADARGPTYVIDSCTFIRNSITNYGIIYHYGYVDNYYITNCRFIENVSGSYAIVQVNSGYNRISTGYIGKCLFQGNTAPQVLSLAYADSVKYNTFIDNNVSSSIYQLNNDNPLISHNNLIDVKINYAIQSGNTQGTANINASSNYWNTTDENVIKTKIYDWFDDNTKGIVEYSPILTAPDPDCPDTTWTPLLGW